MRNFILLLIAFLSGAILMALEMVGFRVIAPDFGSDIYVLGSLIGVFLAALSMGYYLGGKIADRWPQTGVMGGLLVAAGVNVFLLPLYRDPVNAWVFESDFGRNANPLLACLLLFFLPGMLMGTTSPFVIRLLGSSVERLGRTAGAVFAVSTVGSIVGTLGCSFYLINYLQVPNLIRLLGGMLVLAGIISSLLRKPARATSALLLLAVCFTSPPAQAEKVLLERDSAYHRLFVTDDNGYRYLRADNIWHTRMELADPQGRGLPYTDYLDLAFLYQPNIRSVLVIGLGGGTIPKRFLRDYPKVLVDAVEIDPDVVKIAKKYFYVRPGPRLKLFTSDGRVFLRRSKKKYDLIMLDAYYADSVPFFLTTKEFFRIVRAHLTAGGIFVNNTIGKRTVSQSKFMRSVYRTMQETFPQVYVYKVAESDPRTLNFEIFAINAVKPIPIGAVRQRAAQLQGKLIKDPHLTKRVANYLPPPRTHDVPTLTDDYAPVDALLHLW